MKHFCVFILLLTSRAAVCQSWVALGSDDQTSKSIALTAASTFFSQVSSDGSPYISYIDDVGNNDNFGDFKVHARKYKDGKWDFAGNAISPEFPGSDDFPVALDGDVPYVAYTEAFAPIEIKNRVTVKRLNSTTGIWEIVGQQGFSDGAATGTVITANNGKIYVAYCDGAFDGKISVKMYDNAHPASGWQTVGATGFSTGFIIRLSIVIDNGIPYVAYLDFGNNRAFVKKFNGTQWTDVGVNNPSDGQMVVIQSLQFNSTHTPYICYIDSNEAGIVRNLNAANAWVTTGNSSFAADVKNTMSLAILHDIPFVAFGKNRNGIIQVNVKRFNGPDNNWPDAGTQPVSVSPASVDRVSLLSADTKLFAIYRNINVGLFAKVFDAGSVLPVSLLDFKASRQSNTTLVQWVTTSEQDNSLFEIEYSTDGIAFEKIGEMPAQNNSNVQHTYNFRHSGPSVEINYYRLKQVDKNGTYTYSKIVRVIIDQQRVPVISVFPNPVTDVLHVENLTGGKKEIFILNGSGETVRHLKTSFNFLELNVAGLSSGRYFVNIHYSDTVVTRSFVK